MKKVIGIVVLSVLYLASCNNEVVECHIDLTTVGEIAEGCFEHTIIEEEFTVFRSKKLIDLSTEEYGGINITMALEDRSYGIAGPTRGDIFLIPQNANVEIAQVYAEYEYCYRYRASAGPDPDPFYMFVDSRICKYYSEEELNNVDTVRVENHYGFVVRPFDEGEEIQGITEWASDSMLIKEFPYRPGEFVYNEPKYILFRVLEEETIRYGWIEVFFKVDYDIGIEIRSSGVTQ